MILKCLLLAAAWCALTGEFAVAAWVEGFVLSWLALALAGAGGPLRTGAWRRLPAALGLALFFLWELVIANVNVALAVLGPRHRVRPVIVAVPLEVRSDAGITLLANLITLTPGSLSVDVASDRSTLYVHTLSSDEPEQVVRAIKSGFERRVRRVLP